MKRKIFLIIISVFTSFHTGLLLSQIGRIELSYSTYLGGSSEDRGHDIFIDSAESIYISGITQSVNFPTKNSYQSSCAGSFDAYITKLSSSGSSIIYSTFLGGSNMEYTKHRIVVDLSHCAYISGCTSSINFPTKNPYQSSNAGHTDVFVTKFSSSGSTLLYSTFIGGQSTDASMDITIDCNNCVYVTGRADSSDFPTKNSYQSSNAGAGDPFVTKLSSSGSFVIYSTFLGGSGSTPDYS